MFHPVARLRSAISFDGALPTSKQNERVSRLVQNVKKMNTFRNSYKTLACPIPTLLGSVTHAFLAPALKEALSNSDFAAITRIVPGEADDWCASVANEVSHPIIFTSDTDLILYRYPPECKVVFFKDVEFVPSPVFSAYWPTNICGRLELENLVTLAHTIIGRPWGTLSEHVKCAQDVDLESSEYLEFSQRYTTVVQAPCYLSTHPELDVVLQQLDVRISEYVHAALDSIPIRSVYLPLLVEDANQASAWNCGQNIRTLAYALLERDCLYVQEYRRKAHDIAVQKVRFESLRETQSKAAELARKANAWMQWTAHRDVPQELIWQLFSVSIVTIEQTRAPHISLVLRVLCGDFDNTWNFIQLTARLQAALYSLRMLAQCISVWLVLNRESTGELYDAVDELHAVLKNFPAIADMFIVPGQARTSVGDEESLRRTIEELYASIDMEVPTEVKKMSRAQRKLEKRKLAKEEEKQMSSQQRSNNVFAILGME
ncbi:XPG domain containing-domain-containing protein [Massariosphaeria phaeospora]|uniref:XPG domain containing-domain-containing protein n=1 Tax=Massariosphaeria phaeospora TaxID=100035 RepID=A0A7C8I6P2_9PLEO|nr:XPG domain containing-domain-containing protein [Massariosphaeria phaeospora]